MARMSVPPYIEALRPYRPGQPLDRLARQHGLSDILSMASNESAFGASPRTREAISAAVSGIHFYPDASGVALKERLAERHRVSPEQIVLGNGSGELIELAIKAFAAAGERVVMSRLGFIQVRLAAQAGAARLVEVATEPGTFRDSAEGFAELAQGAKLVFIANPNNPTGTFWTAAELEKYFASGPAGLTVLDEAYAEYVERDDYPSGFDCLRAGLPVMVLRTFSKIFGLAGLRIGYGVTSAEVADYLERVRSPYNTNSLAQTSAVAALEDEAYVAWVRGENRRERTQLASELCARGALVTPSVTNFLLVHPPTGRRWDEELLLRGVQVRALDGWGLPGALRVTVGTSEMNRRFLATWDQLAEAG